MPSVSVAAPSVKVGMVSCPTCQAGPGGKYPKFLAAICTHCKGCGVVPDPSPAPAESFMAVSADAVVDVGGPLKAFVDELLAAWSLEDEDIGVWAQREGRGPRLVALLRSAANGRASVTWL